MNIPKIVKIQPNAEKYILIVQFNNGITKEIDLSQKANEEFYIDIKNKDLFEQVRIDAGGYGISWNDDIDMSEFELWNTGVEIDYQW